MVVWWRQNRLKQNWMHWNTDDDGSMSPKKIRKSKGCFFPPLVLIAILSTAWVTLTHPNEVPPCLSYNRQSGLPRSTLKPPSLNINSISVQPYLNFTVALHERSGPGGVIILALVDEAFVDMAVNLYLTSFRPHFIEEFLFVGAGRRACDLLSQRQLPCVVYTEDKDSAKASEYNTVDFKRKMNIRTSMIIEALGHGFTVIHTDLDVVFLKNPLPSLMETSADVAALWDNTVFNAGFVLVRPTSHGRGVYREMEKITTRNRNIDDQTAMNMAIQIHKRQTGFKVVALDKKTFLCGLEYFEKGNRLFPSPCEGCIVVHNNWIVSKEAKVYRFKEHYMWKLDDDGYYSSTDRKFISYNNPLEFTSATKQLELDALKSALALGRILNRTLILPRFHCSTETTAKLYPLNALIKIRDFDKQFGGVYRETTFLSNDQTPFMTESDQHIILTLATKKMLLHVDMDGLKIHAQENRSIDSIKITEWFGCIEEPVLRFHSLYGVDVVFANAEVNAKFETQLKEAFVESDYRQLT